MSDKDFKFALLAFLYVITQRKARAKFRWLRYLESGMTDTNKYI